MGLVQKAKAVERIFQTLDKEIGTFKGRSGLKCLDGCGACCKKPDIEATILEFLPLAVHLYKTGMGDEILDRIEAEELGDVCILFSPIIPESAVGFCSQYAYRGLICRLFGFGATKDKNGALVLATCKKIKEAMPELFQKVSYDIQNGAPIPIISHFYSKLQNIDLNLALKTMPINLAIKFAIETVSLYYYYKNPKAS